MSLSKQNCSALINPKPCVDNNWGAWSECGSCDREILNAWMSLSDYSKSGKTLPIVSIKYHDSDCICEPLETHSTEVSNNLLETADAFYVCSCGESVILIKHTGKD